MKKFEYLIKSYHKNQNAEEVQQEFNTLGAEGWEIITIEGVSNVGLAQVLLEASATSSFLVVFKRELVG